MQGASYGYCWHYLCSHPPVRLPGSVARGDFCTDVEARPGGHDSCARIRCVADDIGENLLWKRTHDHAGIRAISIRNRNRHIEGMAQMQLVRDGPNEANLIPNLHKKNLQALCGLGEMALPPIRRMIVRLAHSRSAPATTPPFRAIPVKLARARQPPIPQHDAPLRRFRECLSADARAPRAYC